MAPRKNNKNNGGRKLPGFIEAKRNSPDKEERPAKPAAKQHAKPAVKQPEKPAANPKNKPGPKKGKKKEEGRCEGIKSNGDQCTRTAQVGSNLCGTHIRQASGEPKAKSKGVGKKKADKFETLLRVIDEHNLEEDTVTAFIEGIHHFFMTSLGQGKFPTVHTIIKNLYDKPPVHKKKADKSKRVVAREPSTTGESAGETAEDTAAESGSDGETGDDFQECGPVEGAPVGSPSDTETDTDSDGGDSEAILTAEIADVGGKEVSTDSDDSEDDY